VNDADVFEIDVDSKFDIDSHVGLEVPVLVGCLLLLRLAVYYALMSKTKSINPKFDVLIWIGLLFDYVLWLPFNFILDQLGRLFSLIPNPFSKCCP